MGASSSRGTAELMHYEQAHFLGGAARNDRTTGGGCKEEKNGKGRMGGKRDEATETGSRLGRPGTRGLDYVL